MLTQQVEQVVPGGIGVAVLLETRLGVRPCEFAGAHMDRDGLADLGGGGELGDEGGLLDVYIGVAGVVIVETDLADREAERVARKLAQLAEGFGRGAVCFLRMDAGGGVELR